MFAECFVRVTGGEKYGAKPCDLRLPRVFAWFFGPDAQVREIAEHLPVLWVQAVEKCFVVKLGGALGFIQAAKLAQLAENSLAPDGQSSLPLRQQRVAHIALLLRREAIPHLLAIEQRLALLRREAVPALHLLANLRLALRWKREEPLIVIEEPLLLLRRHLAQAIDPRRWHGEHAAFAGLGIGGVGVWRGARAYLRRFALAARAGGRRQSKDEQNGRQESVAE